MSKKIRILTSKVTNPWFNLATEDWIFRALEADTHVLFLWRNSETVVIGRYQNPWVECKLDQMEHDDVYLARRQSGGGTVFHDLGNTNFTFLSPKNEYDQDANFQIIIDALSQFGVNAEKSGRNDLLVDGRKVSGSAFKHTHDRSFHHGTLLINANMAKLGDYLNPHPLKLQAKGIKSVRSRVANLVEYNPDIAHDNMCQAIIDGFCSHHQLTADIEQLDELQLANNDSLNSFYDKMADWDWRFGKTPEFTHHMETKLDWGLIDLHLNVKKAVIDEVVLFSDALDVKLIESIQKALVGRPYVQEHVLSSLDTLVEQNADWTAHINEFKEWLKTLIKP